MAYTPTTWQSGDTITAEKLNNIESGISNAMLDGTGLWGFTKIPSNSDLNDFTGCGYYAHGLDATVSSLAHCPASSAFTMRVWNALGDTDHDAISGQTWRYRGQEITTIGGDKYIRIASTDGAGAVTFSAWKTAKYE